jgi:hypothetical protein
MEEKNKIERLISNIKLYAESKLDLAIINIQDKLSGVVALIASYLLLAFIAFFIILFLSLGAAWYIGETTGVPSMGYFSLAGFYLVTAILIYIFREKLIMAPIINAIIKVITIHEED